MSYTSKTEMLKEIKYTKISHFKTWVENTKNMEIQKYTEEEYNADLKKWFKDEKFFEKKINSNKKYLLHKMIKIMNGENMRN